VILGFFGEVQQHGASWFNAVLALGDQGQSIREEHGRQDARTLGAGEPRLQLALRALSCDAQEGGPLIAHLA
jgi:hypothetical protein